MSEQNTEFDKWFNDYEHNNDIRLAINYGAYDIAGDAWQSATAEANKRINELDREIALREAEIHGWKESSKNWEKDCYKNLEAKKRALNENTELQVHMNDWREALEDIAKHTPENFWQNKAAKQALSKTPAQSLQEHDNEVIEKCAKVCDDASQPHQDEIHTDAQWGARLLAANIRALKGTQ